MHDIEPFYRWRPNYIASEDERSPFYGRVYDEFRFTNKIYNYFIHPQWDKFGSQTLYMKILFADYDEGFACIELIGEWNDCITNDVMFVKREIVDHLMNSGIVKFVLLCEHVLNFHGEDDSYYEEWYDDLTDEGGWICFVNTLDHVAREMEDTRLQYFIHFGEPYNNINWRTFNPKSLVDYLEGVISTEQKQLT